VARTVIDELLRNNAAYAAAFDKSGLRTNPFLAERSKIRGFVYEVETGRLRQVG
jgi:hypothetical protein